LEAKGVSSKELAPLTIDSTTEWTYCRSHAASPTRRSSRDSNASGTLSLLIDALESILTPDIQIENPGSHFLRPKAARNIHVSVSMSALFDHVRSQAGC